MANNIFSVVLVALASSSGVWGFQAPGVPLRTSAAKSACSIVNRGARPLFGADRVARGPFFQHGSPRRSLALRAADDEDEFEELEPIGDILTRLASISDGKERMAALRDVYWRVDNEGMQLLAGKISEDDAAWKALLADLQTLTQERMETGKDTLMELLNAGEITVLDSKITKFVKKGVIDPAFLNVLNLNLEDAQRAGKDGEQRLQIMIHIYTRVQEEMEKRAKPSMGLVHKLLRLMTPEFAPTRANILEDTLKPKPEEEREMVIVDGKLETDYGAKVSPLQLSEAIKAYMDQIRGLDNIEDAKIDEDTIGQAFEDCRVIAKEARAVVERLYEEEMLDEFTDSLTPVFEPIMTTLDKYRRPA